MVLDEKSAEKLYKRLRLIESDESTYKIAFENESGTIKDVLSHGNRWLTPNVYLRILGKTFIYYEFVLHDYKIQNCSEKG